MMNVIGLDIGTSSVKGVTMGPEGKRLSEGKRSFICQSPREGWMELEAEVYLEACCDLLRQLTEDVSRRIGAVCAASASGNLLLLDSDGVPLTRIINWQDRRVKQEARELLRDICAREIYEASGWSFDYHTFPLAQLCYLRCHEPQLLDRCGMICMSTEYLYWRLTGVWGIGRSAGTPSYLLDQEAGVYNGRLLEILGIRREQLPPVRRTGEILGRITKEGAALSGLPQGIPLVLGSFDHPAAAKGAGVLQEGQMLLSCGTSWVGFYPVKDRERILRSGALADPFCSPEGCWGAMVSVPSVGERIRELVKRYLGDGEDLFERFMSLAAESEPGAGGLVLDLEAESSDKLSGDGEQGKSGQKDSPDDAAIRQFPQRHIARAIMEGTVRLLQRQIEGLAKEGIRAREAVMVGQPSESALWLEVISQMTGLKVRPGKGGYTGAEGAALSAAEAVGISGAARAGVGKN